MHALTIPNPLAPAASERATPEAVAGLSVPASLKAAAFALLRLRNGALAVTFPNGRTLRYGDPAEPHPARLVIRDGRVVTQHIRSGSLGFAEAYMSGAVDTPDLTRLISVVYENMATLQGIYGGAPWARAFGALRDALLRQNSRAGAKRNIAAHYDLGNAFYAQWLDETMSYSAALYAGRPLTLAEAQREKYRALARRLELKPGDRVLEIGCGWGGFMEVAAQEFGATVVGLTLSKEQRAFASARLQAAGLAERTEVRLQDYRDVPETYDKIASIEMFEAVGQRYWPSYFAKVRDTLPAGGRAALQIITIRDDLFDRYARTTDFIRTYIFPGGLLPSIARLKEEAARSGLTWLEAQPFALDYAETLKLWAQRFAAAWPTIAPLGFDERFRRMWLFYLYSCEACFRAGQTDVVQLTLAKPAA